MKKNFSTKEPKSYQTSFQVGQAGYTSTQQQIQELLIKQQLPISPARSIQTSDR